MTETLPATARRFLPYLPGVANALLVIVIGLTAARLFWLLWPRPELPVTADLATHERSADGAAPVNLDTIAAANLFGEKAAGETAGTAMKEIEAPETRLELTLTGIVSSRGGASSRAMIKDDNGEQHAYAVGDTIAGGVTLYTIYANRVILDRGGRYETLTLEREKTAEGVQRVERGERVTGAAAEQLGTVRQQLLDDPSKISQYLRLQPERRDGNLVGYRIYPAQDQALFNELGLRPGELVTAVNGIALDDARGNMEVLRKLSQAGSVTVTLGNGSEQRTMTVSFE